MKFLKNGSFWGFVGFVVIAKVLLALDLPKDVWMSITWIIILTPVVALIGIGVYPSIRRGLKTSLRALKSILGGVGMRDFTFEEVKEILEKLPNDKEPVKIDKQKIETCMKILNGRVSNE